MSSHSSSGARSEWVYGDGYKKWQCCNKQSCTSLTSTQAQLGAKHVETTVKFCGRDIHTMDRVCVARVVMKDADIK